MTSRAKADAVQVERLYARVYEVIRAIPSGRVATYGQVAQLAEIPRGHRVVAYALRISRPEMGLPWQRVIGKASRTSGKIAIKDPVGGATQRARLESEGVQVSDAGVVSLRQFGWLPIDR